MILKTVKVYDKTRNALLDALRELATIDDDFNGGNGPKYLWDESKDAGYNSNMEFLINEVLKKEFNKSDEELVQMFVGQWIDSSSYYIARSLHVHCDNHGRAEFIALAVNN